MMFKRSTSTPIRPVAPAIEEPISKYQQPLRPGPLSSPAILPFEIGSTIANPIDGSEFQLIQPLGNGSYAVVYMVREKSTNKYYALKCLSKVELTDYHLEVQRNEVRIHEQLSHPNIVKLNSFFETSDWLFLVLEYCEGQDLYFWLTQNNDSRDPKTGKQLSERERISIVKQVFIQILDAVGYCHNKGVAHRDLKPENFIIMIKNIDGFGGIQVKLTDFGLATDEDESMDFDCGSKPYMSYECRNPIFDSYNPRLADIWSLGIIFLNLLYHRSPWSDPSPDQCKSFATFQLDKAGFLKHRFTTMPEKVANFLANNIFNSAEKGRIGIIKWREWCDNLVEKMLQDDEKENVNDDAVVPSLTSILKRNSARSTDKDVNDSHNRDESLSDSFGEFATEIDFSAPTLFDNKRNSDCPPLKEIMNNDKRVNVGKILGQENDDNEIIERDHDANNSDADSGFGTDEDNGNIIKRLQESKRELRPVEDNNSTKVPLSVSPPKIIYCKPKPWNEQRIRGHQRESSNENVSNSMANINVSNHWNSSNQRRERLIKSRKEKQEQQFSIWGANRRRGSLNDKDSYEPLLVSRNPVEYTPPRKQRNYNRPNFCQNNGGLFSGYKAVKPMTNKAQQSPRKSKSSQSLANSPPKNSDTLSTSSTKIENTLPTRPHSPPKTFEKNPKKVTRSTKTNLSKMLAGVVTFNRSVKVGGHRNDI